MSAIGSSASPVGASTTVTNYTNRQVYDIAKAAPTAVVQKEVAIARLRDELTAITAEFQPLRDKWKGLEASGASVDDIRAAKQDAAKVYARLNQVDNQLKYLSGEMSGIARAAWEAQATR